MDQLSEAINFCCSFSSSEVELSTNKLFLSSFFYIKDHNGLPVKNNNKLNAIFLLYLCLSLPLALLLPSSPTPFKIFSCLPTPPHPTPFGIFSSPSTPPYPFEIIDCFSFKTGLLVEPRKAGSYQRQNFLWAHMPFWKVSIVVTEKLVTTISSQHV